MFDCLMLIQNVVNNTDVSVGRAGILHSVLIGQELKECSYKSTLCKIARRWFCGGIVV